MKLLHHGWAHDRNKESIIASCAKFNIDYEYTDNISRINTYDYDILWLPCTWISPDDIPENIKIIFGPHFWVFPTDDHPLIGYLVERWKHRCFYICLSDWIINIFNSFIPSLKVPMYPLPLGLDTDKFSPNDSQKEFDFVIIFKNRHKDELMYAINLLQAYNLKFNVLLWRTFKHEQYIELLRKSKGVLWIGCHESQGFAFQEALSCDTPILVWNVRSMFQEVDSNGKPYYEEYRNKKELLATSATSWDVSCGEIFYEYNEMETALSTFLNKLNTYKPREFILNNLTYKICFSNILKKLNIKLS